MDELRSPSLPTSPAAPIIVFPLPSMLSVLQFLGTIRCPEKPRAAHRTLPRNGRADPCSALPATMLAPIMAARIVAALRRMKVGADPLGSHTHGASGRR